MFPDSVALTIHNCEDCPKGKVCFDSEGSYVFCPEVGQIPLKGIHSLCPLRYKLPNDDPKVWKIRELDEKIQALGPITDDNVSQYGDLCTLRDGLIDQWLARPGMPYMTSWEFREIIMTRVPGNTLFVVEESACSCCRPGEALVTSSLMEALYYREEKAKDHETREMAEGLVEAGMAPWLEAHPEPEFCWHDYTIVEAHWEAHNSLEDHLWGVLLGPDTKRVEDIRYRSCPRDEMRIHPIYPKKQGE